MAWRFIRASMSICGVFPPMVEKIELPSGGEGCRLLVDGCYIENVPADSMRKQGAAIVLAVDVGSEDDTNLTDYGDDLSGWWLLYKKLNPFSSPIKVPTLPDIQNRLAYISCVRQLEKIKGESWCEYVKMPIEKYRTIQFGLFDEISELGYRTAKEHFEKMTKNGRIDCFRKWKNSEETQYKQKNQLNEFIDLAQIICKVPETVPDRQFSSSEDELAAGYASEPGIYRQRSIRFFQKRTISLSDAEIDSDELEELPIRLTSPPLKRLVNKSPSDDDL